MKLGFHFTKGTSGEPPAWHVATTECAETPYKALSIYGASGMAPAKGALCCLFRLSSVRSVSRNNRVYAQNIELLDVRDLSEQFYDLSRHWVKKHLDQCWATAPDQIVNYIVHGETKFREQALDLSSNKVLTAPIPGAITGAVRAAANGNPAQAILDSMYQVSLLRGRGSPFSVERYRIQAELAASVDALVYRAFGIESASKREQLILPAAALAKTYA